MAGVASIDLALRPYERDGGVLERKFVATLIPFMAHVCTRAYLLVVKFQICSCFL